MGALAFGAIVIGVVVLVAKSPALVPENARAEITRFADPVFVTVSVSGLLVVPTDCVPKLRPFAGLKLMPATPTPVPESGTLCGLPDALSVKLRLAERDPIAEGVKVTFTFVLALGVIVIGVGGFAAKSPALAPPTEIAVMVRLAVPVFVTVTGMALLVVLIAWLAKLTLVGKPICGAIPVPVSATVCVLLFTALSLSVMVSVAERDPAALGLKVTLTT